MISGTAQIVHRLTEKLLDRLPLEDGQAKARVFRLANLYFVALPIAALSHTLGHEAGHAEHLRRDGSDYEITITRWPWPVPIAFARIDPEGRTTLAAIAGGSEAAYVKEMLEADRIYEQAEAHYFDWIAYAYAKLDTILYIQDDLRATNISGGIRSFRAVGAGDPRQYVLEYELERLEDFADIEALEARLQSRARSVRRESLFALADLSLVSAVVRTVQYVATGRRNSAPLALRVGGVGIVPSWHFVLTPAGFERRAAVRLLAHRQQFNGYARAVESPSGDDLRGFGGKWIRLIAPTVRGFVAGHVWKTAGDAKGYGIEVGARKVISRSRGFEIGGTVGYKSRGYLESQPETAGVLGSMTARIRF